MEIEVYGEIRKLWIVEDIEDACEVYKNHMGGELQDGQSKASDLLREQIEKMGLLAAAAEEEREGERRERAAMQGELHALQEETRKATNAAGHVSQQMTGLAAVVDEFAGATTAELALTKQAVLNIPDEVIEKVKTTLKGNMLKGSDEPEIIMSPGKSSAVEVVDAGNKRRAGAAGVGEGHLQRLEGAVDGNRAYGHDGRGPEELVWAWHHAREGGAVEIGGGVEWVGSGAVAAVQGGGAAADAEGGLAGVQGGSRLLEGGGSGGERAAGRGLAAPV
mgnify:CR=1 FL=1